MNDELIEEINIRNVQEKLVLKKKEKHATKAFRNTIYEGILSTGDFIEK